MSQIEGFDNFENEEYSENNRDLSLFIRLMQYARPYMKYLIVSLVLLLLLTVTDLAAPFMIKIAIDDYLNPFDKPLAVYEPQQAKDMNITNGIEYEGKVYKKLKSVTPDMAGTEISRIVLFKDKYYLIKGNFLNFDANMDIVQTDTGFELIMQNERYPAKLLDQDDLRILRSDDINAIIIMGLTFFGIILFALIMNYAQVNLLSYTGQNIVYKIRKQLFEHMQLMPVAFFDKNPLGKLITRVTNDTEVLNDLFTNVLVNLIKDVLILLGALIIMFVLDVRLAVFSVLILPIIILSTYIFRIKVRDAYRHIRAALSRLNTSLSENISGMKIIQIFNRQENKKREFVKINEDNYRAGMREIKVFGIFRPFVELISAMTLALLIWFGGASVLAGEIKFGVLYAFVLYIQQFFQPINDIAEKYNIFQSSLASSERIFNVLDTPNELGATAEASIYAKEGNESNKEVIQKSSGRSLQFKGDIEFKDVWFSYNNSDWVLKDLNFKIKRGQTVAIVGPTGSGKTSMINLLNRFYEIQKGSILIDGQDIKTYDREDLRRNIGVVLQDVFLFSGTIKENISFNEEDVSDAKVKHITSYVNADKFIECLPEGYDEIVQERGATLSSGQRQLLAFSRALAVEPTILVLDEATSNIDTDTEILIQDALSKITKDRTTIVIAHRLSTIQHADNIILLHRGRIREFGTHQQLLSKKGMYYDLYRLQYKENV